MVTWGSPSFPWITATALSGLAALAAPSQASRLRYLRPEPVRLRAQDFIMGWGLFFMAQLSRRDILVVCWYIIYVHIIYIYIVYICLYYIQCEAHELCFLL